MRAPDFEVCTREGVRRKSLWRTQLDDSHHFRRHGDGPGFGLLLVYEGGVWLLPQQHHVTSKGRLSPLDTPQPVSASTALGSVGVEEGFEGLVSDAQQGLRPLSALQRAPGYYGVMAIGCGTMVQLGLATLYSIAPPPCQF